MRESREVALRVRLRTCKEDGAQSIARAGVGCIQRMRHEDKVTFQHRPRLVGGAYWCLLLLQPPLQLLLLLMQLLLLAWGEREERDWVDGLCLVLGGR